MTVRDVIGAIGRRWYAFIVVLAAAALLTATFAANSGIYSSRTTVTFTLPARTTLMLENGTTDSSVIAFAGAVATEINLGRPVPSYSSAEAPFYGAGVREGVLVSLRNNGNQWMASYPTATIDIQIVGRTHDWVEAKQEELLGRVLDVTAAQQASVTSEESRITATVEPLTTQVQYIAASRSSQILAFAAMTVAALISGIGACVAIDRVIARARSRSRSTRRLSTIRTAEGQIA